uniref:C2H2-type domain-containing protein n=1 Tax=Caenorhabditis japonica TaxID=281687 RepID=A0A8R1DQ25_CAEJA
MASKTHLKKAYVCHVCHRRFGQQCSLDSHINIHNDAKPYKCETHTVRDHAHLMIPSELEWYRVQVDRAQRYNTQARIKMGKIFVPEPEPARQQKEAEPDLPRMTPLPPLELPVRRQPAEQHQPRGDWMYVPQYREYVCAYQEY